MKRLTAAVGLGALVVGAPLVLAWAVGPPGLPSFEGMSGDYVPVDAVLGVVGLLAWGLWAYLAFAIVLNLAVHLARAWSLPGGEMLAAASATATPRIVRRLVELAVGGAFVAASVAGPTMAGDPAPPSRLVTVDGFAAASSVRAAEAEPLPKRAYRVRPGDSLWRIAERELGSGFRWREIYRLNKGERFADGRRLEHPRWIEPGWILELPSKKGQQRSAGANGSHESEVEAPADPNPNGHGGTPAPVTSAPAQTPHVELSPNGEPTPGEAESPDVDLPARPVLNLPSGAAVAASFASGMLTAHLLGRLHRRRSRPASEEGPIEEPPEPALTGDLRRAGASPMAGALDSALDAVVTAWREHCGVSPRLLGAIEGDRAVRVFVDSDQGQLPPPAGGNLSPSVRFSRLEGVVQAEVRAPFPTLLRRRLSPLERGLMLPIARAPDGSAVHAGVLASGGMAVGGAESEGLVRQLVLAAAAQGDPEDVRLILVGPVGLPEPMSSLPNVVAHDWEDAASREIHAELLRRSRLFFEEGVEDVWTHTVHHPDERLPALLIVATEPPADLIGVMEAINAEGCDAGAGLLSIGWRASSAGLEVEVASGSGLTVRTSLPVPHQLAPLTLDDAATRQAIDVLAKAHPQVERDPGITELLEPVSPADASPTTEHRPSGQRPPLDNGAQSIGVPETESPDPTPEAPEGMEPSGVPPGAVAVRCLGPFEVWREGRLLRKGWRNKARELLAYLVAHRSGAPKDRIIEELWPGIDPTEGSERFDRMASEVRTRVRAGDDSGKYVDREDDVFHLEEGVWWSDAWEFERLISEADQDPDSEIPKLRQATELYRGEFCRDYYYPWAEGFRERFRSMAVRACSRLADLLSDQGEHEQALAVLDQAIEADPVSEDLTRRAMVIEALLGRRAAALSRYRRLEAKLDADLDVEPDPETQTLARTLQDEPVAP